MGTAIYARYSSENQRPESIEDQISSCRKFAGAHGYQVDELHIYVDRAASGARRDRGGLAALRAAAAAAAFETVLVDDLSRLARNTLLLLSVLEELRFHGIRVLSVAEGLDTDDQEATFGIQMRGVFNELQLMDLKKKTLRGQMGQKQRGFIVGEATFGYRSVPVGEMRLDKKGRPRPDGYKMTVEPRQAAVVLRIFREFAEGKSESRIVKALNAEGVSGRRKSQQGWSPATVHRVLRNEKYVGRWVWNKMETRRDPKTGRRRQLPKPESEWFVMDDQTLRIVPQVLWEQVQLRMTEVRKAWPGGRGIRGFEVQKGGRARQYPTDLLSGAMSCGACGSAMVKVSGKSGGYYGCLGAVKNACTNRLMVRRSRVERIVLAAVRDALMSPENLDYVLERVKEEVEKASTEAPETISLREAEYAAEERRVTNFVEFIAEGRGSRALADALLVSEKRVEVLRAELEVLRRSRDAVLTMPPREWIEERISRIQPLLEQRTERSALLLRQLLGIIQMEATSPDVGRPYYKARTNLDVLAVLDGEPGTERERSEPGSITLHWWRRRESNPRPRVRRRRRLHA